MSLNTNNGDIAYSQTPNTGNSEKPYPVVSEMCVHNYDFIRQTALFVMHLEID